jgi:hypothetical protein
LARIVLVFILIGYWIVGGMYAIYTPAWQAPDEPAHYNYIAQVAEGGCCPVIQMGDWDSEYLDTLKGHRFSPELLSHLPTIQYEDHQPPLYYLVAAPIFNLSKGSLVALRLYSVALGTVIIVCAYAIGRILLPSRAWVAVSAAAFVAFLPQNVAILASVNNDALGWGLIAVTLLVTVWYLMRNSKPTPTQDLTPRTPPLRLHPRGNLAGSEVVRQGEGEQVETLAVQPNKVQWRHSQNQLILVLGVLVGLIFVTKATGYLMAGVVVLAIYLKHRASLPPDPLANVRGPTAMLRDTLAQALRTNPFVTVTNLFEGLTIAVPYWLKRQLRQPFPLLGAWALFLVPAVLIGSLWWVRNFGVYGVPDFLGLRAHDGVVVGQARTVEYIAQYGQVKYWSDLAQTTFTSFWGQFGWMALPLNGWLLWVAQGLTLTAVGGWIVKIFLNRQDAALSTTLNAKKDGEEKKEIKQAWVVIVATGVLAIAAYAYYNTEFLQFQARYMYAGLIPFALAFALGLEAWAGLVVRMLKINPYPPNPLSPPAEKGGASHNTRRSSLLSALYWVATVVPVLMLAPFCLYLLWKVIVPNLAP